VLKKSEKNEKNALSKRILFKKLKITVIKSEDEMYNLPRILFVCRTPR
jgi:hypothetical protein